MEEPSKRLVDQRIRSRIMQTAELFADGAEGVRAMGDGGLWINWFYDWLSEPEDVDRLTTLTAPERERLKALCHLVDQCTSEMQRSDSFDRLIDTGWPDRIAPVARAALEVMASRGMFSDDVEEDEPSQPWPRSLPA